MGLPNFMWSQMVTAFKMNSWDDVPEGFEPVYNAKIEMKIL